MTAINFDTTIYIKPVRKSSAQGREKSSLENRDTKQVFNRGFHKASGIEMPVGFIKDAVTGNRITGLDKVIDNPYEGMREDQIASQIPSLWMTEFKEKIVGEPTILVQTYLEIKWGLPKGTLSPISQTMTMVGINNAPHKLKEITPNYIDSFSGYLSYESNTQTVQPSKSLEDSLLYLAVLHNPKIAANFEEVNENVHEFYISLQRTADVVKTTHTSNYKKAVVNLSTLETEQNAFTRYMVSVVLNIMSGVDLTDKQVTEALNNYVMSEKSVPYGPQRDRLIKFNKVYDQFANDFMKFNITYIVRMAINTGIFLKEGIDLIWVTRDSSDNRRKLGSSLSTIYKNFYNYSNTYDESVEDGNAYGELLKDLRNKQVKIEG